MNRETSIFKNFLKQTNRINKKFLFILLVISFSVVPAFSESENLINQPVGDFDVIVYEFEIKASGSISPGKRTIRVKNMGTVIHEVVVFRLLPGKTVKDFISSFKTGASLSTTGRSIANMEPIDKGEVGVFTAEFQPGNHILLCFMSDPKTGQPHFLLGMNHQFTVE